jgi:hypothetical protein
MSKNKRIIDGLNDLLPEGATSGEMLRALRKRERLTLEEITGVRDNNIRQGFLRLSFDFFINA